MKSGANQARRGVRNIVLATAVMVAIPMALQAKVQEGGESVLHLNDIQVIGSHNSYRSGIAPKMLTHLSRTRRDARKIFNYAHPPLSEQLDIGVRQLELDVFADPLGGRFAAPPGEKIAPVGVDRAIMSKPGFKVMHIPGLDYHTNCPTLRGCLSEVRKWSKAHPGHLPIFLTIDAKDQPFKYPGAITPLHLDEERLDALDAEIFSVFGADEIITPDDVRGGYPTLRAAVLAGNWPTLETARGQVMFIFDVRRETADTYRTGHPSLKGRAMFSLYRLADPEAATFIVQDPRGREDAMRSLVRLGFIIRTRSDANTQEARDFSFSRFRAAQRSGAQMISTDYYPGAPDPQRLSFQLSFEDKALQRCNPVTQPESCELEED